MVKLRMDRIAIRDAGGKLVDCLSRGEWQSCCGSRRIIYQKTEVVLNCYDDDDDDDVALELGRR